MAILARQMNDEATIEVGVVLGGGEQLTVRVGSSVRRAERAASCLLETDAGDTVLLTTAATGSCFILAVLRAAAPRRVALQGDATIVAAHGRLDIAARDDVALVSKKKVEVSAAEIDLRARVGSVAIEKVAMVFREVLADFTVGKVVAERFDGLFGRLSQRAERVYRVVSGSEHVRAQQLDYSVKETLSVKSKNTVMIADDLVKIDGTQIHVG